jgi:predicted nicotinamide N-methyase
MPAIPPPDFSSLRSRLHARYQLQTEQLELAGITYSVATVADSDRLIDELIAKGEKHPDVVDERIPYWVDLWPSAIGLGQHLIQNPSLLAGKTVLELGCGLAFPSIVAGKLGATVSFSDYLPEALELAQYNWYLNGLPQPSCFLMDWREPELDRQADLILASDVVYEARAFAPVARAFRLLCKAGGQIVFSEPGRPLGQDFCCLLKEEGFSITESSQIVQWGEKGNKIKIYSLSAPSLA